ncbi:MAG: PEGA domain-containing protein [Verrucomicrobiota bacterium]
MESRKIKQMAITVGAVLIAQLFSNCATIVRDDEQAVSFSSDPPGADLTIDNRPYGMTPTMVKVERDRGDRIISVSKEGYHTTTFALGEKPSAMVLGNIIFGGIVGVGVDALTGDNKEYDSHVHVELIPTSRPAPPPFVQD